MTKVIYKNESNELPKFHRFAYESIIDCYNSGWGTKEELNSVLMKFQIDISETFKNVKVTAVVNNRDVYLNLFSETSFNVEKMKDMLKDFNFENYRITNLERGVFIKEN